MAPNSGNFSEGKVPTEPKEHQEDHPQEVEKPPITPKYVWRNFVEFGYFHVAALYGIYLLPSVRFYTIVFTVALYLMNNLGITAGAHRLWAHRSYKARLPFRILLAMWNSLAFQNDIIEWARDHRVHHKYSETDADPHNAKRGFFFSHIGWLLQRKHPAVKEKGKNIDVSDLYNDPVCRIQRKVYMPSVLLCCFILPTVIPWYFWGESLWNSYFVCAMLRYMLCMHVTFCVNSFAHMFGNKPYDKFINPVENAMVSFLAVGEGFHNYHHTFPQDYSTSEFGFKLNLTTMLIDFMAAIGQVYDRKKMTPELVKRRQEKTGDGTIGFGYYPEKSKKIE